MTLKAFRNKLSDSVKCSLTLAYLYRRRWSGEMLRPWKAKDKHDEIWQIPIRHNSSCLLSPQFSLANSYPLWHHQHWNFRSFENKANSSLKPFIIHFKVTSTAGLIWTSMWSSSPMYNQHYSLLHPFSLFFCFNINVIMTHICSSLMYLIGYAMAMYSTCCALEGT